MAEDRCGQSLEEGVGVSGHTVSGAGPSRCSRDAAPGLDHWWAHRDTVQNHLDLVLTSLGCPTCWSP